MTLVLVTVTVGITDLMVHNYKRVVKWLGCMALKGLGQRVRLDSRLKGQIKAWG